MASTVLTVQSTQASAQAVSLTKFWLLQIHSTALVANKILFLTTQITAHVLTTTWTKMVIAFCVHLPNSLMVLVAKTAQITVRHVVDWLAIVQSVLLHSRCRLVVHVNATMDSSTTLPIKIANRKLSAPQEPIWQAPIIHVFSVESTAPIALNTQTRTTARAATLIAIRQMSLVLSASPIMFLTIKIVAHALMTT